jgi:hypothetical protein
MTNPDQRGALTAQPTCRLRQRPRNTGSKPCSLEISHASRLRRKLCGDATDKLVVNVWGVGYRLIDGELHQAEDRVTVR